MAIQKAKSNVKKEEKERQNARLNVSDDAQNRLSEVLSDSTREVSLGGKKYVIRALRFGTQYRICQAVCNVNKNEQATFGDIIKQFTFNIPAIFETLTLAILNDKDKIFKDGVDGGEYSETFNETQKELTWNCKDGDEIIKAFMEVLQMIDVSFFMETLGMLQIFKKSVTEKKRERTKMPRAK